MRSKAGPITDQGPFIDLTAMTPPKYVQQLRKAGRPVPSPATIRALIDTGASASALDVTIVSRLGLTVTGRTLVHGSTSGDDYEERDLYAVSLYLGSQPGEVAEYTVNAVATHLASEGFFALIGWDILSKCVLVCDGPAKAFTLQY
jgi:hypothetical protein